MRGLFHLTFIYLLLCVCVCVCVGVCVCVCLSCELKFRHWDVIQKEKKRKKESEDRDREIENRLIKFVPLYQTVFLVMFVLVINAGDWHNMSKVTELPQVKINIM